MRALPETLAAKLAGGATTLAFVWRLTRKDGAVFGFTDHDRPLDFDGLVCEPATGLVGGAIEKALGLAADTAAMSGALNAEAISGEDISRGLWDGARVDLYRVDWSAPSLSVHLFAGRLGEVKRGAEAFEAELRGLQADLNRPVGRVFTRFCDADLGDARCGLDLESASYKASAVVSEIIDAQSFRAGALFGFADHFFTRGRLVWDDGGQSEIASQRDDGAGAVIALIDPPGAALVEGAGFTIYAGCDKRFETCRTKFANSVNFRGFPYMPGNDAVQAGPGRGRKLDGSSRYK